MIIEFYDYLSGQVLNQSKELDFGSFFQKQHCIKPIVFKIFPDTSEASISNLQLYLEDKGIGTDVDYGYYKSAVFESGIESGSSKFANHFIEVPDASSTSPNGVALEMDTTASRYMWIDAQASTIHGTVNSNFRLFYNT